MCCTGWGCGARLRRGRRSLHELARSEWEELVDAGAGRSEAQRVAAFFTAGGNGNGGAAATFSARTQAAGTF